MNDKLYMIDDKPVSAKELIEATREIDAEYDESGFYQTSVAAGILRKAGHSIRNNPDYNK